MWCRKAGGGSKDTVEGPVGRRELQGHDLEACKNGQGDVRHQVVKGTFVGQNGAGVGCPLTT